MASSGTTAWSMTLDEVLDEAILRSGGEPTLGHEVQSARRSLNLLYHEWSNRGINLWKLEQVVVTLSVSVTSYTLPSDSIDVLRASYRRASTNNDYHMDRISYENYLDLPNKSKTGRSSQYMVERLRDSTVINLWPIPDTADDQFVYWQISRIEDAAALADNADVPDRFLPPLISGLAYHLARSRVGLPEETRARLKGEYKEDLELSMEEDRDRAPFKIHPKIPSGRA